MNSRRHTAPTTYLHCPDRPDVISADYVAQEFAGLLAGVAAAEAAADAEAWSRLLLRWNELSSYVVSEFMRKGMLVDADAADEAAVAEYEKHATEITPAVDEPESQFFDRLLKSRHRPALERRFGRYFFERQERQRSTDTVENLKLHERLDALYLALHKTQSRVAPTIGGRVHTQAEIESLLRSPDRTVRTEAFRAMGEARLAIADEMAEHVTEILRVRHRQALNLGHRNSVVAGYAEMGRTGYDARDMQRLRDAIERHLVPIGARMTIEHARRLGAERLSVVDMFYDPASTLPRGIAAPVDTLLDRADALFAALSPRLSAHFRQLRSWNMIDIETRLGKDPVASCATLHDEGRVRVTMSAVGDASDVMILLHELGHAFQKIESMTIELIDLQTPTSELAEIHSETMQFLGGRFVDRVIPAEHAPRFRSGHWSGTIRSICAIARFDAFQHWLHEHPAAGASARERMLVELEDRFSPGIDWTGFEAYRRTRGYEAAQFYYVPFGLMNYALARMIAMQIAMIDATDHDRAMAIYLELCRLGGTVSYLEAIDRVGLRSPFDEDFIADLGAHVAEQVEG
jgi:M3 family oligoendopeptidase